MLGSVAPTPIRSREAEQILTGKQINAALIEQVAQAVSGTIRPISDVRSSAEYRREMAEIFTKRAIREALKLARIRGKMEGELANETGI